MNLEKIMNKIENFIVTQTMEEGDVIDFFDDIGAKISEIKKLSEIEVRKLIVSLFHYLKNQSPTLEENWSFIHLIEDLDKPKFNIYNEILIKNNKENPSITSILLLNRHMNTLKGKELQKALEIFNEIIENKNIHLAVREKAKKFLAFQNKKNEL